ncbi:MAG: CDGSH iron-sulfur domain-containing protein [Nitrospinae bacterium]|nr:CDGSH iron-sulfur domain-containing protein [Nitrospinota bacterium]
MKNEKKPYLLTLEAGEYYFCPCGKSNNKPFCDGSHRMTTLTPFTLQLSEKKQLTICGCGKSKNFPCCDGAHLE